MGDHAPPGRGVTAAAADDLYPPREIDAEALEIGRKLFAREAHFVAGATGPSALPRGGLPEIAFAGRSNVGKSSLVNALTGRRMLARTSKTPGRTRQINFFELGGALALVDLPGYGYAEASKSAIRSWTALVRQYLSSRAALRRVCLLVDSRHGLKESDRLLMSLLDAAGVSYQAVLTKADRPGVDELARIAAATAAELAAHPAAHPEVHLTSAVERRGVAALRATLGGFAPAPQRASAVAAAGRPR
jgi:GTP-binding protein